MTSDRDDPPTDHDTEITRALERPRRRRLLLDLLAALAGLSVAGVLLVIAAFYVIGRDLPQIRTLADYRPKQATVVYGKDDRVVARFATERRTVVPYERMPKVLIDAVVSAEDAEFFKHGGLDYLGITRCMVRNLIARRVVCGGSTITQQTVKTFLLSSSREMGRKLREGVLAKRLEDALTKEQILYLYLNQIYFGHGAYGVEEASRVFFGKGVERLTVEEAALLAGLPQSPSRLDPFKNPERAKKRREYVLEQMTRNGKIDEATRAKADATPIQLLSEAESEELSGQSHFVEQVRRELEERLGKEKVSEGGLTVFTGLDPKAQKKAEVEVKKGVEALDRRQGYRGPILHLEPAAQKDLIALLKNRLDAAATSVAGRDDGSYSPVVWDLSEVEAPPRGAAPDPVAIAEAAAFRRFSLERRFGGIVIEVEKSGAIVDLGGTTVEVPLKKGLDWARRFSLKGQTPRPTRATDVLRRGDIVLARGTEIVKVAPDRLRPKGMLDQLPKAQAALVSMDPDTREVRALVGGYGSGAGTFNRATQALRQAGSTMKPFVYGTALETEKFTAISKCLDAPQVQRDPWTGRTWEPENYDHKFDGEITLRFALTKSKNLCSVWLIHQLGVDKVIDFARRAGIRSPLPKSDTLALGSGDVTPLEVVNAYATFAAEGQVAEPIFILRVADADGRTLFEQRPELRQAIPRSVAYLATSLMQSVVEDGTAQAVKVLNRPVAGKTGTTNEARNAWFVGFTPNLVSGVWVGFDSNDPLGPQETGGRAAIPIWLGFMQSTLESLPIVDFVPPPEIMFARVDAEIGVLATAEDPAGSLEPFMPGTEPKDMKTEAKPTGMLRRDDYEN
ncbi:MAG: PBP1A family penicillin-binding protein [Deltaproteobacteria bacterium]|nr:PBP1A family penicillin-binding protein [Deltaproteobacteria bacterium]